MSLNYIISIFHVHPRFPEAYGLIGYKIDSHIFLERKAKINQGKTCSPKPTLKRFHCMKV